MYKTDRAQSDAKNLPTYFPSLQKRKKIYVNRVMRGDKQVEVFWRVCELAPPHNAEPVRG
jgi:hypothetical protein